MQIPKDFKERVERVHGRAGLEWLATLPALVSECSARWSLELGEPFDDLSYNLVLPGIMSGGTEIVLKMGVPCRELLTEAAALGLFQGVGAVRLLDQDAPRGLLLLERVSPGTPLYKSLDEAEATLTAALLMRELWRIPPADHPFPSLPVWFRSFERLHDSFDGGTGPFPHELIESAESVFTELNESYGGREVILHGDLHHANILFSSERGWLAIDPKGICGDPGYEIGSFMLNRLPIGASVPETMAILNRRLTIFSDTLEIERTRLARWAFCHAVLSALWSFEEADEWGGTLHLARMLERCV